MKRIISFVLCFALIFAAIPVVGHASSEPGVVKSRETERIILEDGSFLLITTEEIWQKAANTKAGRKTYTCCTANGNTEWTATLTGTFTYNGTSSSCTNASISVSIVNTSWHLGSKNAYPSGNSAIGTVTMNYKILGITTKTVSRTITLTCDANGNLT